MKKLLVIAAAAFLTSGVALAHDGDKKCEKGKACCKKEQVAKGKSCCKKEEKKETKTTTVKTSVVKKG